LALKSVTPTDCFIHFFTVFSVSETYCKIQNHSGKTKVSLPRGLKFPDEFCLTKNPTHWSNEGETLKLIINHYVLQKTA